MGPIPGYAFQGRKILKGVWRRRGGATASGCCMVDAGGPGRGWRLLAEGDEPITQGR